PHGNFTPLAENHLRESLIRELCTALQQKSALMSALGHKRTSSLVEGMSALPPKADIENDGLCPRASRHQPKALRLALARGYFRLSRASARFATRAMPSRKPAAITVAISVSPMPCPRDSAYTTPPAATMEKTRNTLLML